MKPRAEKASSLLRLYRKYRRAPDHRAKLRIIRLLEQVLIEDSGAVFRVEAGFDMLLHPRDAIEDRLIETGIHEPITNQFLADNLKAGDKALVAGTNLGLLAMSCSRSVESNGCVIAVEPSPTCLRRSRDNFMLNELPDNIKLVSAALGEQNKIVAMGEAPPDLTGVASIVLRDAGAIPYHVGVRTVPEILSSFGLDSLDLMVLDVQGYELPVLETMRNGPTPRILILHVHPTMLGKLKLTARAYYEAVLAFGYRCFDLFGNPAHHENRLAEDYVVCLADDSNAIQWAR
jgi:FkbM family methyltransferase